MLELALHKLQKIVRWLFRIFFILLFLHIVQAIIGDITGHPSMYRVLDLFDFIDEHNLPTYFSSVNLLLASALLFAIYRHFKQNGRSANHYWLVLSIIFLYLSIDEVACVHEIVNVVLHRTFNLQGVFYWAWVIPAIIICLVLALYFLRFYLRLERRYKIFIAVAALLYIVGAIGGDMIDGLIATNNGYYESEISWFRWTVATIEESMEMLGILIFLYAIVDFMKSHESSGVLPKETA